MKILTCYSARYYIDVILERLRRAESEGKICFIPTKEEPKINVVRGEIWI